MFGIGLPEMILIMAVALIVVGPDKLPDLAKSLARQFLELKKAAESLKDNFTEELDDDLKPWEKAPPTTPQISGLLKDTFERAQPPGSSVEEETDSQEEISFEEYPPESEDSAEKKISSEPDL